MVKVKKLNKDRKAKKLIVSPRVKKKISLERNVPSKVLTKYTILIHGVEGIGKTTLIGQFPDIYFLMFEPNDSYDFYMDHVQSFEDFRDYYDDFMKGNHEYKGLSIDNSDMYYDLAMDYACKKHGFEHPGGMNDYGASWNKVKKVFIPPIRDIMNSKYGLIVSCHTEEKELTTLSGSKYMKLAPDMCKQPYQAFIAPIQNLFYYHYVGNERWLQIVGDEHIVAKNKMKGHFRTVNDEPIFKIPMGESEEEAYQNLMKAFNNKQKKTYRSTFTKREKKFKKKVKRS